MILSGQTIRELCRGFFLPSFGPSMLEPFTEKGVQNGRSYGLSHAGYDIRLSQLEMIPMKGKWKLYPKQFVLGSTVERFKMPNDVMAFVKDKSSWARQGVSVFNTVIEPGWEGWLTLEIVNNSNEPVTFEPNDPIAQVIFQRLDQPVDGYKGKYQNQENHPVPARSE